MPLLEMYMFLFKHEHFEGFILFEAKYMGSSLGYVHYTEGHFTHEPWAVTMKLWEPKRKCAKAAVPNHFQNHGVWSRALKCSVKSYVTMPSTKCYFNEFIVMWGPRIWSSVVRCRSAMVSQFCVRSTSKRWLLRIFQVTMKHDSFDAL